MLRAFFGSALIEEVTGRVPLQGEGCFTGTFLDEVTSACVREFIDKRRHRGECSPKTKHHYKELFHHFFDVALSNGLLPVTNLYKPNPMAALPTYSSARKKKAIIFLKDKLIEEQCTLLKEHPSILAAVMIMIHAGLRRAEALWLTVDSIHNMEYLSVVTRDDPQAGEKDDLGNLKTEGSTRSVTILPPLRAFLESYLPTLQGNWLIPHPSKPLERWAKGAFSDALGKINRKAGLSWNCLQYRHTYATNRCLEGWNVWDLANEMGTSQMIQMHYAAFIRIKNGPW